VMDMSSVGRRPRACYTLPGLDKWSMNGSNASQSVSYLWAAYRLQATTPEELTEMGTCN